MVTRPCGGWGESDHDAHRGRLAGAVGAEEPGHPAGLADEADVVDGGEGAVLPSESFDFDHGDSLPEPATPVASAKCHESRRDQSRGRSRPGHPASRAAGRLAWPWPRTATAPTRRSTSRGCSCGATAGGSSRCSSISAVGWLPSADRQAEPLFVLDVVLGLASYVLVFYRRRWPLRRRRADQPDGGRVRPGQRPVGAGDRVAGHPAAVARDRGRGLGRLRGGAALHRRPARQHATRSGCDLTINAILTIAILGWGMYIGSRRELIWTLRHRAETRRGRAGAAGRAGAGQRARPDRARDARRAGAPHLAGLDARRRAGLPRGPHPRGGAHQRGGDPGEGARGAHRPARRARRAPRRRRRD